MVVWLFAGGGEAEVKGLVEFFRKNYPGCRFHRQCPIKRKPGPRPNRPRRGYGLTGRGLVREIPKLLREALSRNDHCDLILAMDDLDCRDETGMRKMFEQAIDSVGGCSTIDRFIGFAAPELEAWIIADWNNSVATHPDFRGRHQGMRHWLSTKRGVSFDHPESFGNYDPRRDTCDVKLSDAIIESTEQTEEDRTLPRYSKADHTPLLLWKVDVETVFGRCPLFRQLHSFLQMRCRERSPR